MKKSKVLVKIIYCTEDNDLVLHCPQLAVYGVCEGILKANPLNEQLVLDCFETKLNKRVGRFSNESDFLENLLIHGHWSINKADYGPKSLQFYIETQPLLKKMLDCSGTKTAAYTFEYSPSTDERFKKISERITSLLNEK